MNINPRQVLGGMIGGFEEDFEMESFLSQEVVGNGKLAIGGKNELNGFNKNQEEENRERAFYQALKEDYERTQRAKDRMWLEEEINDITTNISTEEKNIMLHYQASYKDRSVYQKAALRAKLIEQRRNAEKKQKEVSIPSPAKQPSALEGVFEGRSGTAGSGTANLSAQATG